MARFTNQAQLRYGDAVANSNIAVGEILEVLSDCPQSINNIPIDAKNHGDEVLQVEQMGPTIRYLIRKP